MLQLESLMHPDYGCALDCHFVAAGILTAVEGGILPPGPALEAFGIVTRRAALPPVETPGSTAAKMPAATEQGAGSVWRRPPAFAQPRKS